MKEFHRNDLMVSTFGMVFQQGISFLSGLIVARVIGAGEYGVFALARNIQQAVCVFSRLGLDIGLQRFIGESRAGTADQDKRLFMIKEFRIIALATSLLPVLLVALGIGGYMEQHYFRYEGFSSVLLVTFLAIPFLSDLAVLGGAYRGTLNPAPAVVAEYIIMPSVRLAAILLLFFFGFRLWGVVIGTSLAALIASAYLAGRFSVLQRNLPTLAQLGGDSRQVMETVRYSLIIAGAMSVTMLTRSVDTLFLGYFSTAQDVGQYSLVQMMLILVGLFGAALGQSLGAQIAEKFSDNDSVGIEHLLERNVRLIALVSCPLFAIFYFWGADLVLIFGPSYRVPPAVVRWSAASALLLTLMACAGFALSMTGKHTLELKILSLGLVSSVVLCATMIPIFGQVGAACAVFISLMLVNILRLYAVWRVLRVFHLRWAHLRILLISVLIAMPFSLTVGGDGVLRVMRALAGATAYLALYAWLTWLLLNPSEKELFKLSFMPKLNKA
jgi:O-antigen/teichoic acid export membrane protein